MTCLDYISRSCYNQSIKQRSGITKPTEVIALLVSQLNPYIRYMDRRTCSVSYKSPIMAYDYRLFAVCEGSCRLEIDGKALTLNKDALIVFPPRTPYRFFFSESAPAVLYDINFDLGFSRAGEKSIHPEEISRFNPAKMPFPPDDALFVHPLLVENAPELCRRTGDVLAEREKGGPYRDELCAALLKALLVQALTRTQSEPAAPPERLIESVGRYLDAHCREKITLEQLGRAFGYHPFYLNRLFRERTGTTLHRRQMECRMNRARSMLVSTGLSVREIADSLGFSSPAYFSELFKAMQGMTPGAYRSDRRREKS